MSRTVRAGGLPDKYIYTREQRELRRNTTRRNIKRQRRGEQAKRSHIVYHDTAKILFVFLSISPETESAWHRRGWKIVHCQSVSDYAEYDLPGRCFYRIAVGKGIITAELRAFLSRSRRRILFI